MVRQWLIYLSHHSADPRQKHRLGPWTPPSQGRSPFRIAAFRKSDKSKKNNAIWLWKATFQHITKPHRKIFDSYFGPYLIQYKQL